MADVLSQNEIDALLKQLSTGELDADDFTETKSVKVKEYDFSRPAKFSKEHLRTLEIIFEHYGRLLSSNLPAYLRKNVQVEVMNSEAVTYSEFSNALSNPVLVLSIWHRYRAISLSRLRPILDTRLSTVCLAELENR